MKERLSLLLAAMAILCLPLSVVRAADVVIGTGGESGVYHGTICKDALQPALEKLGHTITCQTSKGTGENLSNVLQQKVTTGLGQHDVFAVKALADEDFAETVIPVGSIGAEALLCVAKKGGRVSSWANLVDEEVAEPPYKIVTSPESSGTYGTLNFLRAQIPALAANTVLTTKTFNYLTAYGRLKSGRRDLVCMVMVPDPFNERIYAVAKDDDLFFLSINDPHLTTLKVKDSPVYHIAPATIGGSKIKMWIGKGDTVPTLHTGVTLFVNADAISLQLQKDLHTVVSNPNLLPAKTPIALAMKLVRQARGVID